MAKRYFKTGPQPGRSFLYDGQRYESDKATGILVVEDEGFAQELEKLSKTDAVEEITEQEAERAAEDKGQREVWRDRPAQQGPKLSREGLQAGERGRGAGREEEGSDRPEQRGGVGPGESASREVTERPEPVERPEPRTTPPPRPPTKK